VKSLLYVLSGLFLASSLLGVSETATERTLKGLVERQKILLAEAARTDDKVDMGAIKVQLVQLTQQPRLRRSLCLLWLSAQQDRRRLGSDEAAP